LHVLAIAGAKPDVILREVKDYLDVPNSTLTGIIDRLESKGLIERVISVRDRRSYGLKLTGKGREVREEQRRIRRSAAARMLEALDSDAERDAFTAMMVKIGDRISREGKR
jgi:DNA-binding MarR family transcriptional regulator